MLLRLLETASARMLGNCLELPLSFAMASWRVSWKVSWRGV